MFRKTIICLSFLLLIVSCTASDNSDKKNLPVYKIGYMICNSEKETLERFVPFSEHLGNLLGVKFETVAIDTINFTREVEKLDFALLARWWL